MSRLTTKCFGCGKVRSRAYFESYGAFLQKWVFHFFIKTAVICPHCYHNPEEFEIIVRRFYKA